MWRLSLASAGRLLFVAPISELCAASALPIFHRLSRSSSVFKVVAMDEKSSYYDSALLSHAPEQDAVGSQSESDGSENGSGSKKRKRPTGVA